MSHPNLLIGPSFAWRARSHRLTKQGPLRAVGRAGLIRKVGRHVPPLDPEVRMRTVIGGKTENPAGGDGGEPFRALAESGKTLRPRRFGRKPEEKRAAREGAAGDLEFIVHRRKSWPGSPAACVPV